MATDAASTTGSSSTSTSGEGTGGSSTTVEGSTSETGEGTGATTAASTTSTTTTTTGEPACLTYDSDEEEFAPVQIVGAGLAPGADGLTWSEPTIYQYIGPFSGVPGQPASHEGADYVHADEGVAAIDVKAAADGVVVYVRTGCPQSQLFGFNNALRECGSGWGNHVIVDHGAGVFTRYAHLHPDAAPVSVGDVVSRGDVVGTMGNSGRSDERHLHFELASHAGALDPCAPAQSLELVYDPSGLPFQ